MSLSKYFHVSGLDIALIFHHHHSKTFTTFLKPPILTSLSLADNFTLKFTKKIEDTKCDIPQLPTRKLVMYLNKISSLYLSCQINCPFSPFKANPTTNTFFCIQAFWSSPGHKYLYWFLGLSFAF